MEPVKKVAAYIALKYKEMRGIDIDEMSLHKLLYFLQREAYSDLDERIFSAQFYAGQYGPVVLSVRKSYPDKLNEMPSQTFIEKYGELIDNVMLKYAQKDPWSLSTLSHGEISWKNGRDHITHLHKYPKMKDSDIHLDGLKLRLRKLQLGTFIFKEDK